MPTGTRLVARRYGVALYRTQAHIRSGYSHSVRTHRLTCRERTWVGMVESANSAATGAFYLYANRVIRNVRTRVQGVPR